MLLSPLPLKPLLPFASIFEARKGCRALLCSVPAQQVRAEQHGSPHLQGANQVLTWPGFTAETLHPRPCTAQLTTASSRTINGNVKFPAHLPCRLARGGVTLGYHNARGNPTAGRNARILTRENYCVSAFPGRAGFSIFCQILTSSNMRQARLPRIHPIRARSAPPGDERRSCRGGVSKGGVGGG